MSDGRDLHGEDGLGNSNLAPVGRQHVMPSEKLIADRLKAEPGQVSLVCLGPLTGVARAFMRDPGLIDMVDRIFVLGGTLNGMGMSHPQPNSICTSTQLARRRFSNRRRRKR